MNQAVDCQVGGMTCGNCALTISRYLENQGAKDIVANAATGQLHFVPNNEVQVEELFEGIRKLGYTISHEEKEVKSSSNQVYGMERKLFLISLIFWIPLISHMFISWEPLHQPIVQFILCLPSYIIGLYYFGRSAVRSLRNGIMNMDVLVILGASAAFFYSLAGWWIFPSHAHKYLFFETCSSIITLVLFGNFLEEYAVRSTSTALSELMRLQKTKAKILFVDSLGKETIEEVENIHVRKGDILIINSGDQVPVDGVIVKGQGEVDEKMMTGESASIFKGENDEVTGGTVLVEGSIRMKATRVGKETALSQIIELVNKAQAIKPPMQKLADRISTVFVPLVVGIALLTFLINYFVVHQAFTESMMRTIAVMVIACPCAMGLATPAAVMVGMGRAARNGILIKGGDTLEKIKDLSTFVFDKTGTLTTGNLRIGNFHIVNSGIPESYFKDIVVAMEKHSSHPIAKAICSEWETERNIPIKEVREIKGKGLFAKDEEGNILELGSYRLVKNITGERHDLYLLKNNQWLGWIDMKDELRPDAPYLIRKLKSKGYKTVLLSGDRKEKCNEVALRLGMDMVKSEMLPSDKLQVIDELKKEGAVAMVGDGINDSPALSRADVGISLSSASQIAIQSAQMILTGNKLETIIPAIHLGRHTFLTIKQNLFWAFFYNIVALPVAATGLLTPTWGAGIMALSDVVLILNSLRLRFKNVET